MKIKNTSKSKIGLGRGIDIKPGAEKVVRGWGKIKEGRVVQAWIEKGILVEVVDSEPEPDEKEQIQERLDELGVKYSKRSGLDKLRELLAEAED